MFKLIDSFHQFDFVENHLLFGNILTIYLSYQI